MWWWRLRVIVVVVDFRIFRRVPVTAVVLRPGVVVVVFGRMVAAGNHPAHQRRADYQD